MQPLKIIAVLCLYAGTAFSQQKGATVIIDARPVSTDSIAMNGDGAVQFGRKTADGQFVFTVSKDFPKQVTFQVWKPKRARLLMVLEAGDSIHVADPFGEPVFSGNGAGNARVFDHIFKQLSGKWAAIDIDSVKKGTPNDLYNAFDHMFKYAFDYMKAHKKEMTPSFYNYLYTTNYYQALGYKLAVPGWYSRWAGKKLSESIPDRYWDLKKQFKQDDELWELDDYRETVMSGYTGFFLTEYKFSTGCPDCTFEEIGLTMIKYRRFEKEFTGKTRRQTLAWLIDGAISSAKDASEYKPLLDEYLRKYPDTAIAKRLNDLYDRVAKLAVGKKPDAFTLKDVNGKDVTLDDFAGKVIYLDFWASWCGPCRAQMKEGAPKLHEVFKDNKDLVFLYINMDDKMPLAKEAIAEDKIEGTHLFAGGFERDNAIVKAFNIGGIPRYIIIGKDGRIVDNDAPRPSEDVTQQRLKDALRM